MSQTIKFWSHLPFSSLSQHNPFITRRDWLLPQESTYWSELSLPCQIKTTLRKRITFTYFITHPQPFILHHSQKNIFFKLYISSKNFHCKNIVFKYLNALFAILSLGYILLQRSFLIILVGQALCKSGNTRFYFHMEKDILEECVTFFIYIYIVF